MLGYLGLEAFGAVGGVFASATFFAARGLGLATLKDALNSRVRSEFRATANSMASFGFRGAFVVTGLAPAPHTRSEWAKSASAPRP